MTSMRSVAKNMCSVRHRPMPSAPSSRALAASSGVSALARTRSLRYLSAHNSKVWKSSLELASVLGMSPSMTSPEVPSRVMISPRLIFWPSVVVAMPLSVSTLSASQPVIAQTPMPLATTAAWDVMPPSSVRIPAATRMPWISSGVVSRRTRITLLPVAATVSASSAEKTTAPVAPPGLAGRPLAITSFFFSGSTIGCRKAST